MNPYPSKQFDVLIHGASIEGCAAAILFARRGARVGLVAADGRLPVARYRRTLLLHADANPYLQFFGLIPQLEAAKAQIELALWSRAGWVDMSDMGDTPNYLVDADQFRGMLAALAWQTNGVTWIPASQVEHVILDQETVKGACLWDWRAREIVRVGARLSVAADGQHSNMARLLNLPAREYPQKRFQYHAFYRLRTRPRLRTWLLDPDVAVMIPHGNGMVQVVCAPSEDRLAAFERDPLGEFMRFVASLPEGPTLQESARLSPVFGPIFTPSTQRSTHIPGLALIGEAALRSDPLWGLNATRALHESDWLVSSSLEALLVSGRIDAALQRYERLQARAARQQLARIADLSSGRRLKRAESQVLAAATHDPAITAHLHEYLSYPVSGGSLVTREGMARALWANLTYRRPKPMSAAQIEA